MAKLSGKLFTLTGQGGTSVSASLTKKFNAKMTKYDRLMQMRMQTATALVWRTAHAKRPMISKVEMKQSGRSKRVSDPNAQAGVAVDTGKLQASVIMKVMRSTLGGLMSFEGTIQAGGPMAPYASMLEYGTSKMKARPFMRPAIALNKEAIKRAFGAKISSNL